MSAPRLKTLSRESIPGAPAWMDPLFVLLNGFASDLGGLLEGGLTVPENVRGIRKEVVFRTAASVAGTFPIVVKNDLPTAPTCLWVGKLLDGNGSPVASAAAWRVNADGNIEITDMVGLSASTDYRMTLRYE